MFLNIAFKTPVDMVTISVFTKIPCLSSCYTLCSHSFEHTTYYLWSLGTHCFFCKEKECFSSLFVCTLLTPPLTVRVKTFSLVAICSSNRSSWITFMSGILIFTRHCTWFSKLIENRLLNDSSVAGWSKTALFQKYGPYPQNFPSYYLTIVWPCAFLHDKRLQPPVCMLKLRKLLIGWSFSN